VAADPAPGRDACRLLGRSSGVTPNASWLEEAGALLVMAVAAFAFVIWTNVREAPAENLHRRSFMAYNRERPHRGLALLSPDSTSADPQPSGRENKRRDRLGGLIHEYHRVAQHEPTF